MIGAAAAAVLVAGIGLTLWLTSLNSDGESTPVADATPAGAATVEAYLDALVAGDSAAAIDLLPVEDTGVSQVLLDPTVYANATHPSGYTITDGTDDGTDAEVSAFVDVDGQTYPVTFELSRTTGEADEADGWEIASGPSASVLVDDVRAVPEINGVSVDLSGVAQGTALPALPGTYVFTAPPASDVLSFGEDVSVRVGLTGQASAESVAFVAALSDDGRRAAIDAATARVEYCMLSDAFQPRDCPVVLEWEDPRHYAVTDLTRSWSSTPVYTFIDTDSSPSGYGVLITGGDLRIDYTWRYAEGDPWMPDDDEVRNVFERVSSTGTLVPVSVDPTTGLVLDFSAF